MKTGGLLVFTAAVLLGAFLLFLVQPMAGKRLLPLLGAAPAIWTTCLLFFQAVLLAGYAYAHGAARWLGPRSQVLVHVGLVLLPLSMLPFTASPPPPAQENPTVWLLRTLAVSVGLPFFVLSASGPVLQSWFSRTAHEQARAPWFLFAASNAASLAALLAYPVLVEPLLALPAQASLWSAAYVAYAALVLVCARQAWRPARRTADGETIAAAPAAPLRLADVARWIALSAVPSSLTLGVTTYLSTDVASAPLLWVLPLSLYLVTFVVAFSRFSAAATVGAERLLPMQALLVALLMIGRLAMPLGLSVLLHLALFTTAALVCHGRLAQARPAVAHLTAYYLAIALGGVLGAAWNALLAPVVFDGIAEYPLAIVLACALRGGRSEPESRLVSGLSSALAFTAGGLTLAIVLWANQTDVDARLHAALLALPVFVAYSLAARRLRFAAALGLMLLAGSLAQGRHGQVIHAERTFFGVHRIQEDRATAQRVLMHGTTLHGMQSLDPARRSEPLGYYHRSGPVGQAFLSLPAASRARVAVVGLGAGVLASYARPGQRWTFFEIDPAVARIARDRRWFSYLAECGERCAIVIGDARVSLSGAAEGAYDLIVLDAFSSDAIPVHLVTREAFLLYVSRLAAGGAILAHFSNRHLALGPVLGRIAREHGLTALAQADPAAAGAPERLPSEWMIVVRDARDLGPLIVDARWTAAEPDAAPLWTDDFSNLVGVLRVDSPSRPR